MTRAKETPCPPWFDADMPPAREVVLRDILEDRAERFPERRMALFEDGKAWTYEDGLSHARECAAGLTALGVRKGDRVISWLPNGSDNLRVWFGANYLGAVYAPLNTAYRGGVLEHVINSTGASVMIAHGDLTDRLANLELPNLKDVVVVGETGESDSDIGYRVHGPDRLAGDPDTLQDLPEVQPWDIQSIIFTSGTTGPSKGVLSPYLQLRTTAVINYGYMAEGDTILVNLPMFHVGGTSGIYAALARSGCMYVVEGFSTAEFWDQIRTANCATTSGLIGAMAPFLARNDPSEEDRKNPLSYIVMFPVNEETVNLAHRFGFDYYTGFNMTEISTPLISDRNPSVYYSCGRPRTGIECRVVDEHDIDVPHGTPGELIVRSDLPWTMNAGYIGMPEETAAAWRNGWFHTGDCFRVDDNGEYFFVDRLKDTIRRRGENISSLEVETEVLAHPDVAEAIAVGAASEFSEEEVLVAVVPREGTDLDPGELIEFLVPRLAYFMVPRYIRIVDEMPKTETNKPRKVPFRESGVTPDTWDREAHGIVLKKERF